MNFTFYIVQDIIDFKNKKKLKGWLFTNLQVDIKFICIL